MSDDWKPIIRSLMYGLEYEKDFGNRAARTFEVIAMAPAQAVAPPQAIRQAIDDALGSADDLSALYEQPYSDGDLRTMFAALSEKLQNELAESDASAPQAGTWTPAEDDDHAGVELAAGEPLPSQPGGWWRLQRAA